MESDVFTNFKGQVKSLMGIDLDDYSIRQLKHRLLFILRQEGLKDYAEYGRLLEQDRGKREEFLKHLKINVSSFFRDRSSWDVLAEHILPDLISRAAGWRSRSVFGPGPPELRVWCAGCSIGAEPYSLAMLLDDLGTKLQFSCASILASDVVPHVLERARAGRFQEKDIKDIPASLKKRYLKQWDNWWKVSAGVRKQVKFIKHDLLRDAWSSGFDLILCRNVLIYMNNRVKSRLYEDFRNALKTGGILFLGSSELILQPEEYGLERVAASFYRRVDSS